MRALRIIGTLCLVALLAAALAKGWSRSALSDWVWVLAVGHHIENHPDLRSFDVMAATLVSVLISAAIVRRVLPAEPWRTKALRIVGTLCSVALLALVMTMAWGRSGIGDYFWVWAIGRYVEGDPELLDVEMAVVILVSLAISALIMRRILPVEVSRTKSLRIVIALCVVGLLAQALGLAWYRSGLSDSVWVWATGQGLEGHPHLVDADFAVVTLISLLSSAAIVRWILRWRRSARAAHRSMPTA